MIHRMGHSHIEGFTAEENYYFANKIVKGEKIPEIKVEYKDNKVYYSCSEDLKDAKLYYIKSKLKYEEMKKYGDKNTFMPEYWNILCLDHMEHEANLPENAVGKYVEFTLKNGIILTTPYEE